MSVLHRHPRRAKLLASRARDSAAICGHADIVRQLESARSSASEYKHLWAQSDHAIGIDLQPPMVQGSGGYFRLEGETGTAPAKYMFSLAVDEGHAQ